MAETQVQQQIDVDQMTGADMDEVVNIYDEIEIDDMDYEEEDGVMKFFYPCPCGDKFRISLEDLKKGGTIATCPSCSLQIRIISDQEFLEEFLEQEGL